MPTSWVPNRIAQDLKHHYDLCSSMVPTCLNSDKTHALGSQRYKQSLAFWVLSETVILWTKEEVHNNTRINLLLLLSFTFPHIQVENLTFGGGKELQRRDWACSESQKIHAEVGCNQVTNLAVAVAIRQWHRHDPMWLLKESIYRNNTPSKFGKHGIDINTDLLLISSRS